MSRTRIEKRVAAKLNAEFKAFREGHPYIPLKVALSMFEMGPPPTPAEIARDWASTATKEEIRAALAGAEFSGLVDEEIAELRTALAQRGGSR